MNFNIVEGDYSIVPMKVYAKIKYEYLSSDLSINMICKRNNLTQNNWRKILERIIDEEGVENIPESRRKKQAKIFNNLK